MRDILATALHIFVILMMAIFVIGGILAATGSFDHWGDRYRLKRRRRRLLRGRLKTPDNSNSSDQISNRNMPYASSNPEKASVTYRGSYNYHSHNAA
ncbi:hypothetical protein [Mucilaginibacter sp.]|uniref:hypothetical protein n=1 Tax=Mucilaginibacter sp. TaxID=1882438 RepID=UPI0035BBB8F0